MEQVLCVAKESLEKLLKPEGRFFTENTAEVVDFILDNHQFVDRDQAEYDATLKQVIPYVVIKKENQFFVLKRLKKQTESRLHDKLSLGAGGHINPEDHDSVLNVLEAGLIRELSEEIMIEDVVSFEPVGIINQNTGGISDYHVALVYFVEANGVVKVIETEKMEGQWQTADEFVPKYDYFEDWSQVIIDHLASINQKA